MPVLSEMLASDEFELQELMKTYPDLLPIEEFELVGPLLVVGRETPVTSGAVDLICLARGGEILIIEFKTGPQNSDFRHAIAQLLDYGAQIWKQTYSEFEQAVALRFFVSSMCTDQKLRGKRSLEEALNAQWPDLNIEELASIKDAVAAQLASGAFRYILAAQRFTAPVERVIDYMNGIVPSARFYAVELVKFGLEEYAAYGSRTVKKPESNLNSPRGKLEEAQFLEQVPD